MHKKIKKINILYFEAAKAPGGSQKSLYNLLKNINRTKYEPLVACFSNGPIMRQINDLDIDIIIFSHKYLKFITPRDLQKKIKIPSIFLLVINIIELIINTAPVTLWIWYIIKIKKIQILHLNNSLAANFGGIIAAKIARIPFVCHIRGIDFITKKERFISKHINKYIAVSNKVKDHFKKYNLDVSNFEIIYDPVDQKEYYPKKINKRLQIKYGITNNVKVVGTVGRITGRKGQLVFLKAAKKVIEAFPNIKFMLIGAPDNSKEAKNYFCQLKTFVLKENLTNHVIFTGFIKKISDILCLFDIVVVPSIGTESFNMVVSEAMAMGKPVIATDVGGPSELIKNEYSGLLIPPGDCDFLAISIINLLKNDKLRTRLAQNGILFARKNFSIEDCVNRIQNIYVSLII